MMGPHLASSRACTLSGRFQLSIVDFGLCREYRRTTEAGTTIITPGMCVCVVHRLRDSCAVSFGVVMRWTECVFVSPARPKAEFRGTSLYASYNAHLEQVCTGLLRGRICLTPLLRL